MWKWQRCTQIPFHQQNIPHSPGPRPPMLHCSDCTQTETLGIWLEGYSIITIQSGFSLGEKKVRDMGIKQVPSGICVPFTNEEHGKNKQGHVLRTSSGSVVRSGQAEAETRMTWSEPCWQRSGKDWRLWLPASSAHLSRQMREDGKAWPLRADLRSWWVRWKVVWVSLLA